MTFSREGSEGTAPLMVAARAPAAAPQRIASAMVVPRAKPDAKPPQKASPAATVSTGLTLKAADCPEPSGEVQTAPLSPRVMMTHDGPFS